jgi:hypothetical protein
MDLDGSNGDGTKKVGRHMQWILMRGMGLELGDCIYDNSKQVS